MTNLLFSVLCKLKNIVDWLTYGWSKQPMVEVNKSEHIQTFAGGNLIIVTITCLDYCFEENCQKAHNFETPVGIKCNGSCPNRC